MEVASQYVLFELAIGVTPNGVYSPTRVMYGQQNDVDFCQSSLQTIYESIYDNIILRLDEILFFSSTANDLLKTLSKFFSIRGKFNLKLHAKNAIFSYGKINGVESKLMEMDSSSTRPY